MALSEIKTNIQKQETKDEPQTNDSYKIRQIIIKMMEYTHIPIHPRAKSNSATKIQQIDLMIKGNKKLYLPNKTKLTKAQTGKQNQSKVPNGE